MRKHYRKICIGTVIMCVLLCCGCVVETEQRKTEDQKEKTVLRFVNWSEKIAEGSAFDKIIETYEESHPDIVIESQVIPYNQILDQLLIMNSSGKIPDCAQIHGSMMSTLVAADVLEPLDTWVSEETKDDFYENVKEPLIYDGQLMGLPWVPSPDVLYYNKELLERAGYDAPPKTSEELYEMAEKIGQLPGEEKIYGLGISSKKLPETGYQFLPYLWAEGGDIVNQNGEITMETPEMKRVLEKTGKMMENETVPVGMEINDLRALFAQGRLGFIFEGDYGTAMFAEASPEETDFMKKIGTAIAPAGKDGNCMSGFYEHNLGVFSGSQHKKEAVEFIEWLSSSEAIKIYSEVAGTKTPSRKSVRNLDIYSEEKNPDFQIYLESLEKVRAFPQKSPNFQEEMKVLAEGIQRVGINHEDPEIVVAQMQEEVE